MDEVFEVHGGEEKANEICNECMKIFVTKKKLQRHKKTVHSFKEIKYQNQHLVFLSSTFSSKI